MYHTMEHPAVQRKICKQEYPHISNVPYMEEKRVSGVEKNGPHA